MMDRQTVDLLGVRIDALDTAGLLQRVLEFVAAGVTRSVMYVNADCMLLSLKNRKYFETLNGSDLVYADGVGVVYGVKLWGNSLPGRSTGADFMPDFCRLCADRGISLFFLGAREGVAAEAARKIGEEIPNLKIVGTHHGYFQPAENDKVVEIIRQAAPAVLIVGFGAPGQELWIAENRDKFDSMVLWGVGGLFDFMSGRTRRGPQWLLDHGFEWLCRLLVEPSRLWRRYLIGNLRFVLILLKRRFFSPYT